MAYCYLLRLRLSPSAFAQGHGSRADALGSIEALTSEVLLDLSAQWAEMRIEVTVAPVIVAAVAVVVREDCVSRDLEAR